MDECLENLTANRRVLGSNQSLLDERSNRETSRRSGFYIVELVSILRPAILSVYMLLEVRLCSAVQTNAAR